jgi:hypothetical protein
MELYGRTKFLFSKIIHQIFFLEYSQSTSIEIALFTKPVIIESARLEETFEQGKLRVVRGKNLH